VSRAWRWVRRRMRDWRHCSKVIACPGARRAMHCVRWKLRDLRDVWARARRSS
jgi:hypothetical protein